jgi:hypothetical protein
MLLLTAVSPRWAGRMDASKALLASRAVTQRFVHAEERD